MKTPELLIADLARKLDTHFKKVSQVINQGFGLNCNDFVNRYRVEAVKQKIDEGEHNLQTLLGIAFDCGFNSKATINRAFLRVISLTLRQYIKKKPGNRYQIRI